MKRVGLGVLCVVVVLISGCSLFQSGILYQETWSDPSTTAWSIGDVGYASRSIEAGRYHIIVKQNTPVLCWNKSEGPFDNAQIDIDVKHEAGDSTLGGAGLVFRVVDGDNLYVFQIGASGTYRVGKWVANAWTTLVAWTASAAVRTGVAENHLTVIANGTTFTFLVNGTQVTEITDSSFSSGRVGVAVTAYADGANIHESFDNLTVRELK